MAAKQEYSGMLPSNTMVEMVAVHKTTHKAYKKIIELQDFKFIKKTRKFNYYLHQIGHSQYKDAIEI
jgi:hypothetical protein